MRQRSAAAAAALLLAALAPEAAGAAPAAAPGNACFLASDVNGFSAPNDRTVLVRVGVNEIFRLDLMADCGALSFRQRLGLEGSPGSPWICTPLDATIIDREAGLTQRCPVAGLRRLSPEEVAALPRGDRP